MRTRFFSPRSTLATLAVIASPALGEVLFDNGDPSGGFGTDVLSDLGGGINQVGDDFTLGESSVLQELRWWGTGSGDVFRARIFEISDGVIDPTPLVDIDLGVVAGTPEPGPGGPINAYAAPLPAFVLPAETYVLSIVEQSPAINWFWAASCEDGCEGESFRRAIDGQSWSTGNWNLAFMLLGEGAALVCPDVDGSGVVDFSDILQAIGAWGPCAGCAEDVDGNGAVNFADVLHILAHWGDCDTRR